MHLFCLILAYCVALDILTIKAAAVPNESHNQDGEMNSLNTTTISSRVKTQQFARTVLLSTSSSSLSLSHLGSSSIFWKITIIVNDRLFFSFTCMTTLRDDEFFMSGILCTNPGSKKNSFIFKSCVVFLNTIEKYLFFFRSLFSPSSPKMFTISTKQCTFSVYT